MRRENNNLLIYGGTVLFFIIAIVLGIIMYKAETRNRNFANELASQEQSTNETESVSTNMGKTVEEQKAENATDSETNTTGTTDAKEEKTDTTKNNTAQKPKTDEKNNATSNSEKPDKKVTETKKEISFARPTDGEVICEFAKDNLIYSETLKEWITHTAIDIKADKTSVIKASANGVVKSIVNDPRYGLTVIIEHDDGYETVYSNLLTAEFVVEGEEVQQGQTIGTVGNTASFESEMECHLHFELLKDGQYLDPSIYIMGN